MSYRLQTVLSLLTTLNADPTQQGVNLKLVLDDYTSSADKQEGLQTIDVAAATTDQQVPFNTITNASTMLVFVLTGSIDFKLNGTAMTAATIASLPADTTGDPISTYAKVDQPGYFLLRGKVSSLYLSNNGTTTVRVYVLLLGEAA